MLQWSHIYFGPVEKIRGAKSHVGQSVRGATVERAHEQSGARELSCFQTLTLLPATFPPESCFWSSGLTWNFLLLLSLMRLGKDAPDSPCTRVKCSKSPVTLGNIPAAPNQQPDDRRAFTRVALLLKAPALPAAGLRTGFSLVSST